jgi:hypothetical protein
MPTSRLHQAQHEPKRFIRIRNDHAINKAVIPLHADPQWNQTQVKATNKAAPLTRLEAEIFCQLPLHQENVQQSALLQENQAIAAEWLYERYRDGGENHFRDRDKADYYADLAGLPDNSSSPRARKRTSARSFISWVFHETFNLVNQTRLTISYANSIAKIADKPFMPIINKALGFAFQILGLMYFVRLAADIIDVLRIALKPEIENYERGMPAGARFFSRLKRAMLQDSRYARMANDAIWGTINAIGYFLVGPAMPLVNMVINVAGFTFDWVMANVLTGCDVRRYDALRNKLGKVYGTREQIELKLAADAKLPDGHLTKLAKADCAELQARLHMYQALAKKRQEALYTAIRLGVSTFILLVAATVSFVVPGAALVALPVAIVLAGGNLLAGSTISGLGYNLWNKAKSLGNFIYEKITHDPHVHMQNIQKKGVDQLKRQGSRLHRTLSYAMLGVAGRDVDMQPLLASDQDPRDDSQRFVAFHDRKPRPGDTLGQIEQAFGNDSPRASVLGGIVGGGGN